MGSNEPTKMGNNSFDEEVDKESNMHFLHIANSDKPVFVSKAALLP